MNTLEQFKDSAGEKIYIYNLEDGSCWYIWHSSNFARHTNQVAMNCASIGGLAYHDNICLEGKKITSPDELKDFVDSNWGAELPDGDRVAGRTIAGSLSFDPAANGGDHTVILTPKEYTIDTIAPIAITPPVVQSEPRKGWTVLRDEFLDVVTPVAILTEKDVESMAIAPPPRTTVRAVFPASCLTVAPLPNAANLKGQ